MKSVRTVLSLFDGMSCGQIALVESGITFEQYYASEIDEVAIEQTQLNFPKTVQLGDVTLWRSWSIDWSNVDLILAGSPCQGFTRCGKNLQFDDPRSKLFFVFVQILQHVRTYNPKVKYLLENVRMSYDSMSVISSRLSLYGMELNSRLVSAQNRERWYWTNFKTAYHRTFKMDYVDIPAPKHRQVYLGEVLEKDANKNEALFVHNWRDNVRVLPNYIQWGRLAEQKGSQSRRAFFSNGWHGAITTWGAVNTGVILIDTANNIIGVRKLTVTEARRLQTIPDWYTFRCTEKQQWALLGNGWTVEMIKYLLSYL